MEDATVFTLQIRFDSLWTPALSHCVCSAVWTYRQENHGLIIEVVAEAVFTCRNRPAFLTDDENDTEISINTCTATA